MHKKTYALLAMSVLFVLVMGSLFLFEPTKEVGQSKTFTDEHLSFTYPENVSLLLSSEPNGQGDATKTISFLVYEEMTSTWRSTNLRLSYPVPLGESDASAFVGIDDLQNFYEQYDIPMNTYEVDGRTAVEVVTGDMTGETFFIAIPSGVKGEGFRLNGVYRNETVDSILGMFIDSVEFENLTE